MPLFTGHFALFLATHLFKASATNPHGGKVAFALGLNCVAVVYLLFLKWFLTSGYKRRFCVKSCKLQCL